ncbi:MAG: GDP-mannose 4,6-dehydratase [Candidatus Woesearchaeota archaeon]
MYLPAVVMGTMGKQKTILVTGGAGFIGSHVADALLARNDKVIVVDNFNDYYDPKQKEENVKHNLKNKNYVLYRLDILDFEKLLAVCKKHPIDVIVHLAARAGVRPSIAQPRLYYEVNVLGTLNVLECARTCSIKQVIFASSSSVYGNRKKGPFKETDRVDTPISPYAATKKAGEELCYVYYHLYGINCTCLRFFTVYGPRGRPDMAPYLFTKAIEEGKPITVYGDGSSKRDYTPIQAVVEGVLAAIDKTLGYEIIHLGNGKPITLNQFIAQIEQRVGKKAIKKYMPVQPGDVELTHASIAKAKKLLGWKKGR